MWTSCSGTIPCLPPQVSYEHRQQACDNEDSHHRKADVQFVDPFSVPTAGAGSWGDADMTLGGVLYERRSSVHDVAAEPATATSDGIQRDSSGGGGADKMPLCLSLAPEASACGHSAPASLVEDLEVPAASWIAWDG